MVDRSIPAASLSVVLPQFRETPLPPQQPKPPRKRRPIIGKEERVALVREARERVDEADRLAGCIARHAHALREAMGEKVSQDWDPYVTALRTMALSASEELEAARAKLNTLETIALYGTHNHAVGRV